MCGIVAIIDKQERKEHKAAISKANLALKHRGPDDNSEIYFENVSLGQTRLSIVDIENGKQPFLNENKSILSILNGEIYNYKEEREKLESKGHILNSKCDGEIIPHLYEENNAEYINLIQGMFAFILLDKERRIVQIVRDRIGIKPLYIYQDERYFIAASEIKAIAATNLVKLQFNHQAIYDCFTFGYPPSFDTIFKNVTALSPATVLTYDLSNNRQNIRTYWDPNFSQNQTGFSGITKQINGLKNSIISAVDSHKIGDLPIASYLSGGLDSTIITSLLNKSNQELKSLKAFSIKFKDKDYDESAIFTETVKELNIDSYIQEVDSSDSNLFRDAIFAIEQPQFTPLDVPLLKLSNLVNKTGFKVVMTGDGPDELMGGYIYFALNQIRRALSLKAAASFKNTLLNRVLGFMLKSNYYKSLFFKHYSNDCSQVKKKFGTYPVRYPIWCLASENKENLFRNDLEFSNSLSDDSAFFKNCAPLRENLSKIDELDKSIYLDVKYRLPNYILPRTDKLAMANSVEARVPFLDTNVVEKIIRIPSLFKLFGTKEKYALKKAFAEYIPKKVFKNRKFAYGAPHSWIWAKNSEERDDMLSEEMIKKTGIFDYEQVSMSLEFINSNSNSQPEKVNALSSMLTGIYSTQLLYSQFIDQ